MSASFYDTATARFRACREKLSLHPHDGDAIQTFRINCCTLLQEIAEKAPSAEAEEAVKLCRLGLEIAADICKTRVLEDREDGCIIVQPDACPQKLREICVEAYDTLSESARAGSRMHIAPQIERTSPGPEKCLSVLRLYDMQKAEQNTSRQVSNKAINRLFGSRG